MKESCNVCVPPPLKVQTPLKVNAPSCTAPCELIPHVISSNSGVENGRKWRWMKWEYGEQSALHQNNKSSQRGLAYRHICLSGQHHHIIIIINYTCREVYKVGNFDNKGLPREEQNKFSEKKLFPVGIEPETLGFLLWHIFCGTHMPSSLSQLGKC